MRNFRKVAARVLVVFLVVCIFEGAVRYCYEPWNEWTSISKQERTELKGTIDTLYCGTSLAYRAFNPVVLDEKLGTNSFNLSTAGQPLMGAYYLIRESVEENPVRRIYIGLSLPLLKSDHEDISYVSAYENLRTWKWRIRYLLALHKERILVTSLLYSTRVDTYVDPQNVKKNLTNKLTNETSGRYGRRGYRNNEGRPYAGGTAKKDNRAIDNWYASLGESQIQEEALVYLDKIADLCREKDIELTFVILPATQKYLDGIQDLDALCAYYRELAQRMDARLYDFVLYKDRKEVFTDEAFKDWKHFRALGGDAFNEIFAEVLASDHPQDYFYSSVSEFEN